MAARARCGRWPTTEPCASVRRARSRTAAAGAEARESRAAMLAQSGRSAVRMAGAAAARGLRHRRRQCRRSSSHSADEAVAAAHDDRTAGGAQGAVGRHPAQDRSRRRRARISPGEIRCARPMSECSPPPSGTRRRRTIDGVLVQPMAPPGREVILGINRDPTWGPLLMVGLGGVLVEALGDVALAPVPLDHAAARALLGRLKGAQMFGPFRGAAAGGHRSARRPDGAAVAIRRRPCRRHRRDRPQPGHRPSRGEGVSVVDALIVRRDKRGRTPRRGRVATNQGNREELRMGPFKDIGVEKTGHVALVEIRRPPHNFFDVPLIRESPRPSRRLMRSSGIRTDRHAPGGHRPNQGGADVLYQPPYRRRRSFRHGSCRSVDAAGTRCAASG